MLRFEIGTSGQVLVLSDDVLHNFAKHRQCRFFDAEAGGQLFAEIVGNEIVIVEATGPRPTDQRGRTYYRPDRKAEQREIAAMFRKGLHYVGDWHTHPTPRPRSSSVDLDSIAESVTKSKHSLNAFIMIIVGTAPPPSGLEVSIHNGKDHLALELSTLPAPKPNHQ